MLSLRNGMDLLPLCETGADRARMVSVLARYASLRLVFGKRRAFVATVRVRGLKLTLDWTGAEHVPLREYFVRHEYAPDDSWRPAEGEVVVDAGANAGVFALDSARRVGPTGVVVAIEPNPAPRGRLLQNAAANGLQERLRVVPAALGERIGRARFAVPDGNTTIGRLVPPGKAGEGLEVDVRTIDGLVEELGLARIDLLKIDVEGSELQVLRGANRALGLSRRVVVEVNDPRDIFSVERLLHASGLTETFRRGAGVDSGATLVFARRPG